MTQPGRQSFLGHYWPALFGILGAVIVIALVGGRILYRPFNAPSASMEPTLHVGDLFLAAQFAYQSTLPVRGDVIIFHGPRNSDYVKRVVGLPGDHVQMMNGVLYINKKPVPKTRVADFSETDDFGITTRVPQFQETLPDGKSYLVLDRAETDFDNTQDFAVPPDSYFVLGDNRDNSEDSRMWTGGVRRDAIIGRAAKIYVSGGRAIWRDVR